MKTKTGITRLVVTVALTGVMLANSILPALAGGWLPLPTPPPDHEWSSPHRTETTIGYPTGGDINSWKWKYSTRHSGGAAIGTRTLGEYYTMKFAGDQIDVIGMKGPNMGLAVVYIDRNNNGYFFDPGEKDGYINAYAPYYQLNVPVYTREFPNKDERSIMIIVRGTHAPPSRGNWIFLDAMDVWY